MNKKIPFTCRTCGETKLIQKDIHAKNYADQTECLTCRGKKPEKDNLEELMELYKKATQGEWIGVPYNSDHGIIINIQGGDKGVGHINTYNQEPIDANFIVALHNSFPALYERLRVAEKTVELMTFDMDIDLGGGRRGQWFDRYKQLALAELQREGRKDRNDG